MNEQNNNDATNNNYQDPRTVKAEVLGELRKEKIGKPILVVYMLVLFGLALIALPIVTEMLNDEESALYKLLHGDVGEVVTPQVTTKRPEFLDGSVEQPLKLSTSMKFENIVMKEFELSNGKINCKMYSYNGILDLDNEEYYLEIYSNNKNYVNYIKLTGTYDYQEKKVEFTSNDLSFNKEVSYFGKIVHMTANDYPKVELTSDESGLASFTCKKNNRSIEYVFKNNYLVRIKDNDKQLLKDYEDTKYLAALDTYRKKAANFGELANVEEVGDGFLYVADIDLEAPGFIIPAAVKDPNYYVLDTDVKVVHYAMIGKGFDCE